MCKQTRPDFLGLAESLKSGFGFLNGYDLPNEDNRRTGEGRARRGITNATAGIGRSDRRRKPPRHHIEEFSFSRLPIVLRIPSDQLQSALAELKTLGSLIEESEISQDTTAGYTDLVARLSNARRTEQRLLALLGDRAGKLGEIIQGEKEIGEVRERIEKMEGQQRRLENQVRFASVKLEFSEEGAAQFPALRTRIRTAYTDGYRTAIANTITLTLAALRYGPTVVIYFLLLLPLIIVVYRRLGFTRKIA